MFVRCNGHSTADQTLSGRCGQAIEVGLIISLVTSSQENDRSVYSIRTDELFHQKLWAVLAFYQAHKFFRCFTAAEPSAGQPFSPGKLAVSELELTVCGNNDHRWFELSKRPFVVTARDHQEVSITRGRHIF